MNTLVILGLTVGTMAITLALLFLARKVGNSRAYLVALLGAYVLLTIIAPSLLGVGYLRNVGEVGDIPYMFVSIALFRLVEIFPFKAGESFLALWAAAK